MHAVINEPRKISMAIYYNECKVRLGVAECIYAGNFLKDAADLSPIEKRQWFSRQLALNVSVTYAGAIHQLLVTLNFL